MKKHYLILDVETCGSLGKPLVYDLGWAVCDNKGNILKKKSYVINDIFFKNNMSLQVSKKMHTAYYAEKLPQYYGGIQTGAWKLRSLVQARKEILKDMKDYNIKTIGAYNASFDTKALNNTLEYLTNGEELFFFPWDTKVICIWHMACQVICTMKKYRKFCLKHGLVSEKGNLKTSAESVWAFITDNPHFEESHTGLKDVEIEVQIMAECFKKHKKMNQGINRQCWRIPNSKKRS